MPIETIKKVWSFGIYKKTKHTTNFNHIIYLLVLKVKHFDFREFITYFIQYGILSDFHIQLKLCFNDSMNGFSQMGSLSYLGTQG